MGRGRKFESCRALALAAGWSNPNGRFKNVSAAVTVVFCVKVSQVIELLEADGWRLVAMRESHRQFKHVAKLGRVTVAGKLSTDLHPKTEASILRQAGPKRR
jgi:predicted RNA binding protein YcfA (HicA-like mRNA interferase family)